MFRNWLVNLGSRLSVRLVVMSVTVLIILQTVVFGVLSHTINNTAEAEVQKELAAAENLWRRELEVNAERLRLTSAVLASDFAFREAAASNDMGTIESALSNQTRRIGATVAALLTPQFALRAQVGMTESMSNARSIENLALPLSRNAQGTGLTLLGDMPHQFVLVPMRAPVLVGWVLMGFPVSQEMADDVKSMLGVHVALGVVPEGKTKTIALSTLSASEQQSLIERGFRLDALQSVGGQMLVRRVEVPALLGEVNTLLLRSVNEVSAPFERVQLVLALFTLAGIGLFALTNNAIAKRVTRPLRLLEEASERLEEGDYTQRLDSEIAGRPDEIGNLGRAFELMRMSVSRQQQEIRELAYSDRLTRLPNRVSFRDRLLTEIQASRVSSKPLTIIVLDLNRFKYVNDVMGFAFGDRLLAAVAQRLHSLLAREIDLVARLGGNEFAILLPQCDTSAARVVTQRIEQSFDLPYNLDEQTIDLSASMGVASFPQHANDANTLIGRAEVAMYLAKSRSTEVQVYDASMDSSSSQVLSMLTELRTAVDENQLRLYLQPKIDLKTQKVIGAEALVRWQHPKRGLVPPIQFIPFAEQSGFIRKLTLWMIEEVARQWEQLQSSGSQFLRVAINLSTRDLLDSDLPFKLQTMLSRYGVEPRRLCLEITESAIMDDPSRAESVLNRLSEMGFKLSIDDFGTGYSSLAYLKRLPVNELKIDKSFVMGMESDQSDEKIVQSTIDLAHNLGLSVVAEGVENAEIFAKLAKIGCDEAQGFHMSKPLPAADFIAWRVGWDTRMSAPDPMASITPGVVRVR